jgi:hypothetical protein
VHECLPIVEALLEDTTKSRHTKEEIADFIIENLHYFEGDKIAQLRRNLEALEKIYRLLRDDYIDTSYKNLLRLSLTEERFLINLPLSNPRQERSTLTKKHFYEDDPQIVQRLS